ncbi:hypothetical protein [Sandarakinorhabdus sp.]|uniref:hypothetical protein n=1 Tax=Sandarakinorhabdus sp. TaxID=1916663 RepID=UPI00286D8196|nr:hypothetical protein [Sandarakinorhabdus sp.]
MDFTALEQPFTDGGIRTVNFFNGRLLTGADLSREQAARREADARLGAAMGDGIASGLMVRFAGNIAPGGRPAASVSPGLAISRRGSVLQLDRQITLALDRAAPAGENARECLFGDCKPLATGDYVGGAGLYLLSIAPAFTAEGRAQVSGMSDTPGRCATDATVEGVQFRLIEIRPELHGVSLIAANARNRLAYRCFGLGVRPSWPADLAGSDPRGDDLMDTLLGRGLLTDSEVPLALLAFSGGTGHIFTDAHAVRRPVAPRGDPLVLADLVDHRRPGVGEAMFRQFADHITAPGVLRGKAKDQFDFLPAAGLIPELDTELVGKFFAGMELRGPLHIDASAVEPLIRESLSAPAIDTSSNHVVWFYRIAQNRMAGKTPLALFASGHLPYRGDARWNLGHFNFANYALNP